MVISPLHQRETPGWTIGANGVLDTNGPRPRSRYRWIAESADRDQVDFRRFQPGRFGYGGPPATQFSTSLQVSIRSETRTS